MKIRELQYELHLLRHQVDQALDQAAALEPLLEGTEREALQFLRAELSRGAARIEALHRNRSGRAGQVRESPA